MIVMSRSVKRSNSTKLKPRRKIKRSDLVSLTRAIAERHGLRPALMLAQVNQESKFNPRARSPVGAIGIAQIMPATARDWHVNPHDPVSSLHAMARNMRRYIKTHQRQGYVRATAEKMALQDYICGPNCQNRNNSATRDYVRVILKNSGVRP